MSSYDFILDNMRYSFSSVTNFEGCKQNFYLTYIESEERRQNCWGQFGSYCHLILEKYFSGELEHSELKDFYISKYTENVYLPFPRFIKNAAENYYNNGLNFFENFTFDKTLWEILLIEADIKTEHNGIKLTVKPDLVLREKSTGKNILIDFKTANGYKANGKLDSTKMLNYLRQFYLYCYFVWQTQGIAIDEIHVWFIVNGKTHIEIFDPVKAQEAVEWFLGVIEEINQEEEFVGNTSNGNKFYCENLCSFGDGTCKYFSG